MNPNGANTNDMPAAHDWPMHCTIGRLFDGTECDQDLTFTYGAHLGACEKHIADLIAAADVTCGRQGGICDRCKRRMPGCDNDDPAFVWIGEYGDRAVLLCLDCAGVPAT